MIKDKIIEMDNGKNYYVLNDVEYQNKKYLLTIECDIEKDEIVDEDYLVMELDIVDNELAIKQIKDDKIAMIVTDMLLKKVKNSN